MPSLNVPSVGANLTGLDATGLWFCGADAGVSRDGKIGDRIAQESASNCNVAAVVMLPDMTGEHTLVVKLLNFASSAWTWAAKPTKIIVAISCIFMGGIIQEHGHCRKSFFAPGNEGKNRASCACIVITINA